MPDSTQKTSRSRCRMPTTRTPDADRSALSSAFHQLATSGQRYNTAQNITRTRQGASAEAWGRQRDAYMAHIPCTLPPLPNPLACCIDTHSHTHSHGAAHPFLGIVRPPKMPKRAKCSGQRFSGYLQPPQTPCPMAIKSLCKSICVKFFFLLKVRARDSHTSNSSSTNWQSGARSI